MFTELLYAHKMMLQVLDLNKPIGERQGSNKNSTTQFHDFSISFQDKQCFHDYLLHDLKPALLAASSPG